MGVNKTKVVSATGQIIGRGGELISAYTVLIASNSNVIFYDGTDATGKVVWKLDGSVPVSCPLINARFGKGLYAVVTGNANFGIVVS